ncbi:MAG: transposase, partial [Gemmatimonadota bacterium]
MGETQSTCSGFEFNRSVRAEASSDRLSADGGALLVREALHRLGLDGWLSDRLADPRTLLLLQAQGWADLEDADQLRDDPVFRTAVSSRRQDRPVKPAREAREPEGLPSQPTLSRLLRTLSSEANREVLGEALREGADRRHRLRTGRPLAEATVDLDSLPLEVHGHQPGTAFNPHYGMRCYHPLLVRWSRGDLLGARLRPGNAHTADGGLAFALPILRWAKRRTRRLWLRADAGFPEPEFLKGVEAEGVRYVARLRTNDRLKRRADPHLTRPPGRPPKKPREWLHE